jgi:glycosyltransferase involved in cell wall biosynthesis
VSAAPELRVGLTTWNDAEAVELCLSSIARTLAAVPHEVVVVDYHSTDTTAELAHRAGAKVIVRDWSQSDALNHLLLTSHTEYTLLIHSDVILLADDWYPRVRAALEGTIVLVSPEDIGAGPFVRAAIGAGMPESSFLFWRTSGARQLRPLMPRAPLRAARARLPLRAVNLYHRHVTHYLPELLARQGLSWRAMDVLHSPTSEPWFVPDDLPGTTWEPLWGRLAYGFGNFYALDGTITHFHQWYSRRSEFATDGLNDDGVPVAYLNEAAARFQRDYSAGRLKLP